MDEQIKELHERIKGIFKGAASVKIFVNSEGITVEPCYRSGMPYSMRDINRDWIE